MKLYLSFVSLLFLLCSFISNAQEKCKTDYMCRDSPYCGDDMTCFCSRGICNYGPGLTILKNNTNINLSLRGSY